MHTHTSRTFTVLAAAAFAFAGSLAVVAHAQDEKPAAHAAPPPPALDHEMSAMGRAFKGLTRQVKDASKNADSIKLVEQFEMHAAAAKTVLPDKIEKAPEADRPKLIAEYHQQMSKLLRTALDLEDQLANDQNDKAQETLKEMNEIQKEGHKEFRPHKNG